MLSTCRLLLRVWTGFTLTVIFCSNSYVRKNELRTEKEAGRVTDGRAEVGLRHVRIVDWALCDGSVVIPQRTWIVGSAERQNLMKKPTGTLPWHGLTLPFQSRQHLRVALQRTNSSLAVTFNPCNALEHRSLAIGCRISKTTCGCVGTPCFNISLNSDYA